MPAQDFVIQVRGRLPAHVLVLVSAMPASVHLLTVFWARLRDRAAVDGLLRRVSDLALDLVEFQQLTPAASHRTFHGASSVGRGNPVEVEVVVDGPVGDLALSALTEQADLIQQETRLLLTDRFTTDEILNRLKCSAAVLEYVGHGPPPKTTPQHLANPGPEPPAGTTKQTIGVGDPHV